MRLLLIHLLLLITLFSPEVVLGLEGPWSLVQDGDRIKVWLHTTNSNVTLTVQTEALSKPVDWTKTTKAQLFQSLEDKKRKLLFLMGIRDWKAEKYNLKKSGEAQELSVSGTYVNSTGEQIAFHEIHIFHSTSTTQALYTQPAKTPMPSGFAEKTLQQVLSEVLGK